MTLILTPNSIYNFLSATRGLNKPISAKGGFSLFGALRPESNGRFGVGVLKFMIKFDCAFGL